MIQNGPEWLFFGLNGVLMHKLWIWMSMDSGPVHATVPAHRAGRPRTQGTRTAWSRGPQQCIMLMNADDIRYWTREPSVLKHGACSKSTPRWKEKAIAPASTSAQHNGLCLLNLAHSDWQNEIKYDCISAKVKTEPSLPPNITIGSQANSKASPDLWHVMLMRHHLIWLVNLTSSYKKLVIHSKTTDRVPHTARIVQRYQRWSKKRCKARTRKDQCGRLHIASTMYACIVLPSQGRPKTPATTTLETAPAK